MSATTSPLPPAADARRHRLRPDVISLRQGIVIGLATAAPGQSSAGVFAAGIVATSAYAVGPAIVIGMLPMLAIAVSYRRLNLWEQNAGGPYVWAGRALGPVAGYAVAWAMLVGFSLGAIGDLLPLGPAVLSLLGFDPSATAGNVAVTTVLGGAMVGLAALGLRTTARYQMWSSLAEYAILLAFAGLAVVSVFVHHDPGTVAPRLGWLEPSGLAGHGSLASSMLLSVFLFAGWDAPVYLSEETKRRRQAPGTAGLVAVLLLALVYLVLLVSLEGVVSGARLAAHSADALGYLGQVLAGPGAGRLLVLAVVLSVAGTTQATVVAASRVGYSMATDKLLPSVFARVGRNGTPSQGAAWWGAVAVAVADGCALSPSFASAFADVVNASAMAFSCFYLGAALAAAAYYRRRLRQSAADLIAGGVVPLAGAGGLVWVLVESYPGLGAATHWVLAALVGTGVVAALFSAFIVRSPYFRLRPEAWQPGSPPAAPVAGAPVPAPAGGEAG